MRLLHYSDKPLTAVYSQNQNDSDDPDALLSKPHGLWVSVEGEDDWAAFCETSFHLGKLTHEITLHPNANILYCRTARDIRDFTDKYSIPIPGLRHHCGIDWKAIAANYQGIIIAPYIWQCRLEPEFFWYYTWDCASGCIWDADAIASVKDATTVSV